MRVLILTPINPVIAGDAYIKISNHFNKKQDKVVKKLHFLCFPFFADVSAQMKNKEYLPMFFSMIDTSLDKDMQKKLYKEENIVVIGNTYKDQKFDMIVSLEYDEEVPFDNYIEMIKTEDFKDFAKIAKPDNLYTPADAELNLPTIDHAILLLEEAYYGGKTNSRIKS